MRINSKSTKALGARSTFSSNARAVGKSLEKLSSGYRINRAGDGAAVVISQTLRTDNGELPQLIRSSGARPVVRAG